MGGMDMRDMSRTFRGVIANKVSAGDMQSVIAQNADSIRMAVGNSASQNLVSNGAAVFETSAWETAGVSCVRDEQRLQPVFALTGSPAYLRQVIAVQPETEYRLRFAVRNVGNIVGARCTLTGRTDGAEGDGIYHADFDIFAGNSWQTMDFCFTTQEREGSVTLFIGHDVALEGALRVTDIQLRKGMFVAEYTPSPNEIYTSGIVVTDDQVRIRTKQLHLEMTGQDGESCSVMTLSNKGFDRLDVADLRTEGRRVVNVNRTTVYASPSGNDANDGLSPQRPFRTIQRCVDEMAYLQFGDGVIRLAPGTYREDVRIYKSGRQDLLFYCTDATLEGSLRIYAGSCKCMFYSLGISSTAQYAVQIAGSNVYAYFLGCSVNGNRIASSVGMHAYDGAYIVAENCQIHNCLDAAIYVTYSAHGNVIYTTGTNNGAGLKASFGGVITGADYAPNGTAARTTTYGGVILSYGTPNAGTAQGVKAPPTSAWWDAVNTACWCDGRWRDEIPRQGQWPQSEGLEGGMLLTEQPLNTGVWFFPGSIKNTLAGKSIESVGLAVKRREGGGNANPVTLRLWTHKCASAEGALVLGEDLGDATVLGWGQETVVDMPVRLGEMLRDGSATGVAAYTASTDPKDYLVMSPQQEYVARLTVRYR